MSHLLSQLQHGRHCLLGPRGIARKVKILIVALAGQNHPTNKDAKKSLTVLALDQVHRPRSDSLDASIKQDLVQHLPVTGQVYTTLTLKHHHHHISLVVPNKGKPLRLVLAPTHDGLKYWCMC